MTCTMIRVVPQPGEEQPLEPWWRRYLGGPVAAGLVRAFPIRWSYVQAAKERARLADARHAEAEAFMRRYEP